MTQAEPLQPSTPDTARLEPMLVETLRAGYSGAHLRSDAMAGLTVAVLALPLSMAIAIGCGVAPDKGLVTSVVAGAAISALGGSRFQIGGPAAAFIVVVGGIIAEHGYDGMLLATMVAGIVAILAGVLRLGALVRFVPGPVIVGFTAGVGLLIAVSQTKDFLGLSGEIPRAFWPKIAGLWQARHTFNPSACAIGLVTVLAVLALRRLRPRWPGLLIAIVAASAVSWAFGLPVETIGTRFGGIPSTLPAPVLPRLGWTDIVPVLPAALTLAFLISVESLLSAVVADSITRTQHRPNMEVVAQGVANIAAALFGGLPATGTLARTSANIAAGGQTPVAGILHAAFVLALMVLAAPVVSYLALPCLAAVLIVVCLRLVDLAELREGLGHAPIGDRIVLAATLVLTVLVSLTMAIVVGLVLASGMAGWRRWRG